MRHIARRGAWVLLLSVLLLTVSASAEASWLWNGTGTGTAVRTADELTPVVSNPTCTWNSVTKVLTITVTWSKSSYARSTVKRTDVATGTSTTLAANLASTVMSFNDVNTVNVSGGKLTTGFYTYTITATAGTYWTRSGTSAPKSFTLTNAKGGSPDSCT